MPRFQHQSLDASGQTVSGEIDAASVQEAIAQLAADGLAVQSIAIAPEASQRMTASDEPAVAASQSVGAGVGPQGNILEQHLSAVLAGARPLVPALRAYSQEMRSGRRRRELLSVCELLESGDARAAANRLISLPEYWLPLLSAAAATNDPGRVLGEFFEAAERAQELSAQWRRMLTYPVLVAGLALAVVIVISLVVLPSFRELFNDFGLRLPLFTRLVMGLGEFLTSPSAIVTAAAIALVLVVFVIWRRASPTLVRSLAPGWISRRLTRSMARTRFARFSAELLEAGLEPPAAARIAAETTRASGFREAGRFLADDLERAKVLEPELTRPLSVTTVYALSREMPRASRVRLLKEISNCHADRTRRRLAWAQGVLGPIAICVVGVSVGVIVLALFLPLVQLINSLSS
jgi:type IV pilus assembly protein PilC